ncbi:MAG: hemerythrin domain-containing protein [Rhodocyclaceae bacterium]|nr:hemerythrin domain-containing protein [Rhodocyclaceae bacterium]
MSQPTQALRHHHKHCDDLFAEAEALANAGDWTACETANAKFLGEIEAHFATEEQVLFPAFAAATGMSGGPVSVMLMEHAQMRDLMGQMTAALKARDGNGYGGAADTLLILMQQHNMKEENILYPMCDSSLAATAIDIGGALGERLEGACPR